MVAPDLAIDDAVSVLRAGGLVAIPTETVYGLAADAENPDAVARIFEVKGRPTSHPLIVHLHSPDALHAGWARNVPPLAQRLADTLWPGPLTLVLERGPRALHAVTGGLDTVALRVPAHPVALALLSRFSGGLAAPSANRFGSVSPTLAEHVRQDLGNSIEGIVDGGAATIGIESTIIDLSTGIPRMLRPGGVSREAIEDVLGTEVSMAGTAAPRAPGTHASHYAPRARVIATSASEVRGKITQLQSHAGRLAVLAPRSLDLPPDVARIDVPEDDVERARTLYATLRMLDERKFTLALVVLPESERGLGLAIADRLRRAAGPR
jgi:L-threonylcarbamoyladenylate synthase